MVAIWDYLGLRIYKSIVLNFFGSQTPLENLMRDMSPILRECSSMSVLFLFQEYFIFSLKQFYYGHCASMLNPFSQPTLGDPIDCSQPSSTVHGILQARVLEWGCHFLLQGIFLTQGSIWHLLHCMQILYHWASGKAPWWGWVGGRYASSSSKKLTPVAEEYPL